MLQFVDPQAHSLPQLLLHSVEQVGGLLFGTSSPPPPRICDPLSSTVSLASTEVPPPGLYSFTGFFAAAQLLAPQFAGIGSCLPVCSLI